MRAGKGLGLGRGAAAAACRRCLPGAFRPADRLSAMHGLMQVHSFIIP